MFKQFLLVLFLVAQPPMVNAAVPDISGTYSISSNQTLDTCDDLGQYYGTRTVITQTGSSFSLTDSWSESDGDNGIFNINGSIYSDGNITGSYTHNGYESDGFLEKEENGTINGSIKTINNPLTFTIFISGIKTRFNADGSVNSTCQVKYILKLTRTSAPPTVEAEAPTAENDPTGQVIVINPVDTQVPSDSGTIPDVTAVITLENSSSTINRADDSIIEVQPKTIVTLNPVVETTNTNTLVRGEITTTVDCTKTNDYEVRTALADIKVSGSCSSVQRVNNNAKFTTNYSQNGVDATLKVTVISGTVDVTDREGNTFILNAGDEKIIQKRVPRTQWVLPIDEDKLYGGKDNFLIWTQFPEAASYMMEFNLPSPVFAEQNVSTPQFTKQVIPLAGYIEFEGLALLTLPLPKGVDGLVLELRIFALDNKGNIIGESVSSDSSSVTLTD